MRILDLGCGFGRHTIELTKRGFQVVGFDYSSKMLEVARKNAHEAGLSIEFIEGDMLTMNYDSEYDVILSLFSSFGYFSAKENGHVLDNCSRALRQDGVLFLDILNKDWKLRQMKGAGSSEEGGWYTTRTDILSNNLKVTTEDFFDTKQSTLSAKRSWSEDGLEKSYSSKIIIYDFSEIKAELQKSDFEIAEAWGGYKGTPWDDQHQKMLIKAKKKRDS